MKFKKWADLQILLNDVHEAVGAEALASSLYAFVSTAIGVSREELEKEEWQKVVEIFLEKNQEMQLDIEIPMFKFKRSDNQKMNWDYRERSYYAIIHTLCKNYSWGITYIDELDHTTIFALLQEIEIDNQLQREWEWELSEKSVSYDPKTKQAKYHPLPREPWMMKDVPPPPKIMIPKSILPVGNVVVLGEE